MGQEIERADMTDDGREQVRTLARQFIERGDPLGWFEALYGSAEGAASAIPWAGLTPNPNLLTWLDRRRTPWAPAARALVVGCGLGDDAEELAKRGFEVTAFDIAPSAIEWARRRFPASRVSYAVADLLAPPAEWRGGFDLVVEAYTLQAMPAALRSRAMHGLAGFLAPSGELLVICRGRTREEPEGELPWPLMREELEQLTRDAGLRPRSFDEYFDGEAPPVRRFRCVYAL